MTPLLQRLGGLACVIIACGQMWGTSAVLLSVGLYLIFLSAETVNKLL